MNQILMLKNKGQRRRLYRLWESPESNVNYTFVNISNTEPSSPGLLIGVMNNNSFLEVFQT